MTKENEYCYDELELGSMMVYCLNPRGHKGDHEYRGKITRRGPYTNVVRIIEYTVTWTQVEKDNQ